MKVNILLASYNGEKYLAEQIRSIQNQTFSNWQLLIRDDGSSDSTRQIIASFVQEDQRIHFLNPESTENIGVINSFYSLLKSDKADYYFFSDQDDVWLPDKIELTLSAAQKEDNNQPLMVYTDLKVVDDKLAILHESMIKTQSHHANTQLKEELTENTVTGGTSMINHALAEKWTKTTNLLMHDWYLALLATSFGKLVYIDVPTELYRQHANNVLGARTWTKRFKNWIRPHRLLTKYWNLITKSQTQAKHLLAFELSKDNFELVEAFVTILEKPLFQRIQMLKHYGLKKNRWFHTIVFRLLIITKFGYRSKDK